MSHNPACQWELKVFKQLQQIVTKFGVNEDGEKNNK